MTVNEILCTKKGLFETKQQQNEKEISREKQREVFRSGFSTRLNLKVSIHYNRTPKNISMKFEQTEKKKLYVFYV